ncbi:uncharacterized protein LOC110115678 [Dendrobium catenatum]|uniref:Uncharacterized protein n=1 Tax=Dendrobium catenatum TaxID=906689 RepID=A0A2I0XHA0_9ASPA|nr:uncharacterized protein LOC110115678 [Dendrobium catenatum]PKU87296.1 hypothetical protein MA16_Dca024329 [Dendrobium catenatum]
MAPCFSLCFDPHNQPKLPSFLKPFCFPFFHGPFSPSPSSVSFDDGDDGAAEDSDLNNYHVIILEIRQRAMKARSEPRSSFVIMTAEEFARLIKAAPPPNMNKSDDAEDREKKKDGEYEGEDEKDEDFFSVRSCFSRCSTGDEEYCLSGRTAASEKWFRECEGWPFGLWRHRKVVVLPPLPKSPADSWTWHKRNLNNVKV